MPEDNDKKMIRKIAEFLAEHDSETIQEIFEDLKKLIEAKEHLKNGKSNGNGVGSG